MPNKLADLEARLTDPSKARAEMDTTIEQMIANMAEVPIDKRSTNDWAPDGALTKQFFDLTNRQAELDAEIVAVTANRALIYENTP